MFNLFVRVIKDQRRSLAFWIIGLVLTAVLMMLFYPTIVESASAIEEYIEAFPPELLALFGGEISDFSSPEGYLNTELFFMIIPLLYLIFAIGRGAGAVAGEEENHTLDLLLSHPVSRWQVVGAKFAAIAVQIIILTIVLWVSLMLSAVIVDMEIGWPEVGATCLSAGMLGMAFGAFALFIGCIRGSRGLATGVSGGLAVISYFINSLAGFVSFIEPLQAYSLFYYYIGSDPIRNGLDPVHVAVLLGAALVFLLAAIAVFRKRDLAS